MHKTHRWVSRVNLLKTLHVERVWVIGWQFQRIPKTISFAVVAALLSIPRCHSRVRKDWLLRLWKGDEKISTFPWKLIILGNSNDSLKIRLFLKTLAICIRVFLTFSSIARLSTCKWVPVGFSFVDTSPLISAMTPSKTASKSPDPLAGIISNTPELVYFARIMRRGIEIRASKGRLPSLNLPIIKINCCYFGTASYQRTTRTWYFSR